MVSSELWFGAEASFYNGVATQSLRFNDNDTASLSWTPSSAGNRKKWTFSTWLKRSNITNASSGDVYIFSQATGTNNNDSFLALLFRGDDLDVTSNSIEWLRSDAKFKDNGAWYHILWVLDTENSTPSHRMRLYVNGDEITSFSTDNRSNSQLDGTDMPILNNALHYIGRYQGDTNRNFDGYLAYTELVEGEALTPSSFTEEKNGVLIPKKYTGDHGTYGFRLEYKQTGDGSSSASSSTIGADTKSNATKQHWNDNNLDAYDSNMPDSPENNWATLNSIYNPKNNPPTFSEGNLKATASQVAYQNTFSTIGVSSGKWYVEMKQNGTTNSANFIGIVDEEAFDDFQDHSHYIGSATVEGVNYGYYMHSGNKYVDGASSSYGSRTNDGEIIGIALDLDNGKLYFSVDGTFVASGDPVNGTNFMAENIPSSTYFFGTSLYQNGYTSGVWNFGQDSSFGGTETATSNSDVNGNGTFHTAPPTGYLALCSANLPEPTISPNSTTQADDHFQTVLYNGNGGTQSITGVGFQPDWIWTKQRNGTNTHALYDSSRSPPNVLYSSETNAEENNSGYLNQIDSDGFTLGSADLSNKNSGTYVAWNWKANGTTPTKTYKVVVVSDSGNKYRFRNSADSATFAQSAVTLDLQEGGTYIFDWSDSSAQGHPIRFSTTSDGTHGGGSEYTTGVVKDDSAYKTTITIASSAPTLYYYCANHSGMGGQVNTNTTFGSTNFDGSILSVSNTNTTAGFSIVTYTGNATAGATVGHGLGAVPKWYFVKSRSLTTGWPVYHHKQSSTPEDGYLLLNLTDAFYDIVVWNDTAPTSSVFSLGGSGYAVNNSSATYIAYCFAEVEGYSKFGSYTSNNSSTDNAFIYTGFRPAFVMVKMTPSATEWVLMDNKRSSSSGGNPIDSGSYPNYNYAEYTNANHTDFLSNGFKIRATSGVGYLTRNVVYMAFAEQPFKFANAR